ncbi:abortive phage infection protein [Lysinibacillus fusiformis]|uniref:abortive infection family protein n=1 Tax=Lysinibacillus fusiformis TaxID=28031 RepID=UPI0011BB60D2|nr:abortive infection family protein [Lysinibacillus fusiformis]QDZ97900.1 abortive phage infection protein [Lysinibacillus fusiformis]
MASMELLKQRSIIDILIGDKEMNVKDEQVTLPYLNGPNLCEISTRFGLNETYSWNGGGKSRWVYMDDLMEYLALENRISDLLIYLFSLQRFEGHITGKNAEEIKDKHRSIIDATIKNINNILIFSGHEMRKVNAQYKLVTKDSIHIVQEEIPEIIDLPYVISLKERTKEDLINGNFDSVITKCRTLLEEVLIFILEDSKLEITAKGNINKLHAEVKKLLNLNQNNEYDKRINSLLSGVEKIIQAIVEMRNTNSDAHGVGSKRVKVGKREAELIVNSTMTISTYLLQIYEDYKN